MDVFSRLEVQAVPWVLASLVVVVAFLEHFDLVVALVVVQAQSLAFLEWMVALLVLVAASLEWLVAFLEQLVLQAQTVAFFAVVKASLVVKRVLQVQAVWEKLESSLDQ